MSTLVFKPNDIRLLKHWLWVNVKCVAMLVAFTAVMRCTVGAPAHSLESGSGGGSERVVSEHRRPNPIPPTGWRRTNRGWEHTSSWPSSSWPSPDSLSQENSISELIALQESREPRWLRSMLGRVSGIPPLLIALLQIAVIALILTRTKPRVEV